MMTPETRKPGASTPGLECAVDLKADTAQDSPTASRSQAFAARKIAAAFGLSLSVAGVVVCLAGLGDGGAK